MRDAVSVMVLAVGGRRRCTCESVSDEWRVEVERGPAGGGGASGE
jgi:hypothetical protein